MLQQDVHFVHGDDLLSRPPPQKKKEVKDSCDLSIIFFAIFSSALDSLCLLGARIAEKCKLHFVIDLWQTQYLIFVLFLLVSFFVM